MSAVRQEKGQTDVVRSAQLEMEAAKLIAAQVADVSGDDSDFVRDVIEGETSLHEAIRALVASIGEDEAICEGLSAYIRRLQERRGRIERRIELKRALVASGLDVAEIRKLPTDAGTVSLVPVSPKVDLSEEADVPAEFWRAQPPKLDMKSLLAALKEGRAVPGARLSNGGVTIQIRS